MTTERDWMRESWLQGGEQEPQLGSRLEKFVHERTQTFDREIRERNLEHWVAAGAVLLMAATLAYAGDRGSELAAAVVIAIGAVLQASILWRRGQIGPDHPDPSSSALAYRQVLAEKFDCQIRYVRAGRMAEWVAFAGLAIWVGGDLWQAYAEGNEDALLRFGIILMLIGGVVLINQLFFGYGPRARKLKERRDQLLEALDQGDAPAKPPRTYPLGLSD